MAEEQKKDEKKGEAPEKPSDSETKKEEGSSQEDTSSDDELIDELLSDGTPANKEIRVPKDKYDEKNEKSKILDDLSPLLSKLKERPDLVDEALKGKKEEPLEARITRIEEEEKRKKKNEVREALADGLKAWPDLKENWDAVKPIVASLEAQGFSYRQSLERAYYAVNPQALEKERKSIAQQVQNREGVFSSSRGSAGVAFHEKEEDFDLPDSDKEFAAKANIDPKLYKKHWDVFNRFRDL